MMIRRLAYIFCVLLFLLSSGFFAWESTNLRTYVLFYPPVVSNNTELKGELHRIPTGTDRRTQVCNLVNEFLLGALLINSAPAVLSATTLQLCIVDPPRLFLDFSSQFTAYNADFSYPIAYRLAALEKSVTYNFHFIKRIDVTIDGHLLYHPEFSLE